MRKAFSFYRSHYEQMKMLNKTQLADLTIAICEVQFLEVNIEDIKFDDTLTQIVWIGIKHAVDASVMGYVNAKGDISAPLAGGSKDFSKTPEQEKGEEKGEEEEKGAFNPFTFTLTRIASIENTSKEYKEKLQAYIESSNKPMTYKDFYDYCVLKDYKYKDFKRAYDSWNKDNKPKKDREWIA